MENDKVTAFDYWLDKCLQERNTAPGWIFWWMAYDLAKELGWTQHILMLEGIYAY